jgi:quercetin dioxygenase-like cupin family protein
MRGQSVTHPERWLLTARSQGEGFRDFAAGALAVASRAMKRLLIIAALVAGLGTTTAALASSHPKITEKVIAAGGVAQPYAIDVANPADVVVAKATVPAGASFGWHSHRSAVAVVVQSGTLTLYDSADTRCTPQRVPAGHGFVEQPNHVHLARNETRHTVTVLVTYLGLEHGVDPDVPASAPGNCPF